MSRRVLVTGATGLLGSHIAERLVGPGRRVRALVRPGADTGSSNRSASRWFAGDLTDPAACDRAVDGRRRRLPFRGEGGRLGDAGASSRSAASTRPRTLAEAAVRAGVDRFVHISSTSAYGHPAEGGADRRDRAAGPEHLGPGLLHEEQGRVRAAALAARRRRRPAADGHPAELALRRARPDDDAPARSSEFRGGRVPLVGKGDNPLQRRLRRRRRRRRDPGGRRSRLGRARRTTSPTRGRSPSASS